jgi:hypothetical protein
VESPIGRFTEKVASADALSASPASFWQEAARSAVAITDTQSKNFFIGYNILFIWQPAARSGAEGRYD